MKEVSTDMEIKTLGVVGAGQMGSGIAQVAAASGLSVIMSDIKDEFVQKGSFRNQRQPGPSGQEGENDGGRSDRPFSGGSREPPRCRT